MRFFTKLQQQQNKVLKFILKYKISQIATVSKKSNAGGLTKPSLKLHYRAIATKTSWCWQRIDTQAPGSGTEGTKEDRRTCSEKALYLLYTCSFPVLPPSSFCAPFAWTYFNYMFKSRLHTWAEWDICFSESAMFLITWWSPVQPIFVQIS